MSSCRATNANPVLAARCRKDADLYRAAIALLDEATVPHAVSGEIRCYDGWTQCAAIIQEDGVRKGCLLADGHDADHEYHEDGVPEADGTQKAPDPAE